LWRIGAVELRGRVPEIVPIMDRYQVKPVRVYEGGKNYDVEDAIQQIWKQATNRLKAANTLVLGRPASDN
jgi:hypothetical protein